MCRIESALSVRKFLWLLMLSLGEKFVEMKKNGTVESHSDIKPQNGLGWKGP